MKFNSLSIKNFKAISEITLELSDFNIIVGTNGSGKSSILQALHWAMQSGRNKSVTANRKNTEGSTLSIANANYMPSPDYRNSSNGEPYGNFQAAPKMEVQLKQYINEDDENVANIWIKAARNEGISVHIPSNNPISTMVRDQTREISAYIPGLAGIPLEEEKKSQRIVHRQAAAGDANTVLRNFLLLLNETKSNSANGSTLLEEVEYWASKVLGKINLNVNFNEDEDYTINASFQTDRMREAKQSEKPLELAGIGFLQVIQIFAYLLYFKPRFLLIDEPDSHLHPDRQEALTYVVFEAAKFYDCQVLMTTHSPSIVRALPTNANLIWMKNGRVEKDSTGARLQMGWGLLDKRILLLTEDKKSGLITKILNQWPEISQKVAVWPLSGLTTLPGAESLQSMSQLFGDKIKLILHRDGDFLLGNERMAWSKPYNDRKIATWVIEFSDIEAYFCSNEVLAATLNIEMAKAEQICSAAFDTITDWKSSFSEKRAQINKNSKIYPGGAGTPTDHDAELELCGTDSRGKFIGKKMLKAIRKQVQKNSTVGSAILGNHIPNDIVIAKDLKEQLVNLLK